MEQGGKVRLMRKWTLRQKEAYRSLLGNAVEDNTCRKKGKEVGLGRGRRELQCSPNGGLRSLQRVLKMGWPLRLILKWGERIRPLYPEHGTLVYLFASMLSAILILFKVRFIILMLIAVFSIYCQALLALSKCYP